jgi:hypothetical protein
MTKEKIPQHSTYAKPGDIRQMDALMPFLQGTAGFLVAVIGLIPICTALSGVCEICPLFGYTFEGYRKKESEHQVLPDHDYGRHPVIRPVLLQ